MLGVLRRNRNSPIIAFLLILIILVFIAFFGPAGKSGGGGQRTEAAVVDGQVISDREFSQAYSMLYRRYQEAYREFNRETAQSLKLRENVLNDLVTQRILARAAERRGLGVDDLALREAIVSDERFQTDGKFDRQLYERYANSLFQGTPAFEDSLKQSILVRPFMTLVSNGIHVSDQEARQAFEQENRSMTLEFIRVPIKPYEEHVGAVTLPDAQKWKAQEGSAEEIKKYYAKHKRTRYDVPKKVRARHILVKTDKNLPPDARKAAQETIKQARQAVLDGMDFAEAAAKYSEDSTKERGGDLGFFALGDMVGPFEEAAFGLKPGEISTIVETGFGYHVIKVEEIQEPVQRKLEDVEDEIALELAKLDKASELAKTRANQLWEQTKAGKSLAEALAEPAEGPALAVEDTGSFNQGRGFIPKIGADEELAKKAWKLTLASRVPEGPHLRDEAWIVYVLKERADPSAEEIAAGVETTQQRVASEKRNEVYEKWTEWLRKRSKVEINPTALSYEDTSNR